MAVQYGHEYFLVPYSGVGRKLLYKADVSWAMFCCKTGMILRYAGPKFLYVPFDFSDPRVIWEGDGSYGTVENGIVVGSYEHLNWTHVNVDGTVNVIYTIKDRWHNNAGVSAGGYVWAYKEGKGRLYHYDGREPAETKYAGCGGCCEGIVANFANRIVVYCFGGGELVLCEGNYTKWHGGSSVGLFIVNGEDVLLLPYDGSGSRKLWSGPLGELRPFDDALLIKNDKEVVMIPLPQ